MSDPLASFDDGLIRRDDNSEHSFEQTILKKVYRALFDSSGSSLPDEFVEDRGAAGGELDFEWFNDNRSPAISLYSRRIDVSPMQLLKIAGITKTALFRAFSEVRDIRPDTSTALFFTVKKAGRYVIHDSAALPFAQGYSIVVVNGKTRQLRIEPANAFLESLRASL